MSAATVAFVGIHPYADSFPMLPDAELAELVESIRANGLRNPVVITPEGLILDGRNRAKACEAAAVPVETVVYDGDDLAEYVIDCNSARRHMSTGARAMSTAMVLAADGRRENGRWKRDTLNQISDLSDGYRVALNNAGIILDFAPDLAEQVITGEVALDAAYRRACDARDADRLRLEEEQRIEAEEADALAALPDDWKARVGADFTSARVAFAAWEDANRAEAARLRKKKKDDEAKAAAEKKARVDLHTQVLTAAAKAAQFGGYEDMTVLIKDYNPSDLPRHVVREFTPESLAAAARFIAFLTDWQGATK